MMKTVKWFWSTFRTAARASFWIIGGVLALLAMEYTIMRYTMEDAINQNINISKSIRPYAIGHSEFEKILLRHADIAGIAGAHLADVATLHLTLLRHDNLGRDYTIKND